MTHQLRQPTSEIMYSVAPQSFGMQYDQSFLAGHPGFGFTAPSMLPTPQPVPQTPHYVAPTGEKVDIVLENIYQKVDIVGTQLCAFAAEIEELKAEVTNANTLCERELRNRLQQANDEIYQLRNQLSECTDRKK
eukprot:NODE_2308_length_803_cov_503.035809_g1601_i0.p1 GENE.NODE_2308_length_803_cov_503.035809_g1601_i0~~NODE_2308_length_803_cov_503.035809_g1601_i0.p1  ORF type:complete len:148 (+),score=57.71 NODE_2308_length_803_cov_503.035809_g1601_i0:44-445(+)